MILAVSHPGDDHLAPVLEALARRGAGAVVFDTSAFPRRARLAQRGDGGFALTLPDGTAASGDDVAAVWWRRPLPVVAEPGLTREARAFAARQSEEALTGLWATLAARPGVRWMNPPWLDAAASSKPRQLAAATRAGLAVPETLVTNDPAAARAFLGAREGQPVIHKALHATPEDWHTTRLVSPDDLQQVDAIALSPVILQAYVPGVDLRVTVVGDQLFAAEIDARETRSPEDFRPVYDDAKVRAVALPAEVEARIRALVADLGLAYAAVDLRRADTGEHVFLESNPSGQFRFVERRTGLAITGAVAAWLAGG